MSKIIVTGGAGFIGSHLVDALIEQKHQVIVIDDFSTGRKENLKKSKNKILLIHKNLSVDKASIGSKRYLEFGQRRNEHIPTIAAATLELAYLLIDRIS